MRQSGRVPEFSVEPSAVSDDFVWYGVCGLALVLSGGRGGLASMSLATGERQFQRSSASAVFKTATGELIIVESHRPRQAEDFDRGRDTALINMLNWVPSEHRRGVTRNVEAIPTTVDGAHGGLSSVDAPCRRNPRGRMSCSHYAHHRGRLLCNGHSGFDAMAEARSRSR